MRIKHLTFEEGYANDHLLIPKIAPMADLYVLVEMTLLSTKQVSLNTDVVLSQIHFNAQVGIRFMKWLNQLEISLFCITFFNCSLTII